MNNSHLTLKKYDFSQYGSEECDVCRALCRKQRLNITWFMLTKDVKVRK